MYISVKAVAPVPGTAVGTRVTGTSCVSLSLSKDYRVV